MNTSVRSTAKRVVLLFVLILTFSTASPAQSPAPAPNRGLSPEKTSEPAPTPTPSRICKGNFLENIWCDQKAIWTSPAHLDRDDTRWLLPLGLATAGLIATDRNTAGSLNENRTRLAVSRDISYAGSIYSTGAIVTAAYLIGRGTSNRRLRETGKLAAEALIDSAIVDSVFKEITQRPRPREDFGRGRFFTGGNSFPSGHSAAAWSVATVFACQYKDQPVIHYGAYAAASAVGISRFTVRKHFLSDVLVGGALGYGIGRYVCRMGKLRNASDTSLPEHKKKKLLPSGVAGRFDRSKRDYGLALAWNF